MPKGYSVEFSEEVLGIPPDSPAIRLAHACVRRRIPVAAVSKRLGVSRYCVYQWFTGVSTPHPNNQDAIMDMLKEIEAQ